VTFLTLYFRKAPARLPEAWDRLMLLTILGLFLFMGIAYAPVTGRLCAVSPPALILLGWIVSSPGKVYRVLANLLLVAALTLAIAGPLSRQNPWWDYSFLDAPAGRTAILSPVDYDKYQWVFQRTRPGEFFFEAHWPDLYFPVHLRNPAEVPFLTPNEYTRPEQVRNVLEALERHQVRFVLWSPANLDIPVNSHPTGDHLGQLRAYLRDYYHVVKTFSDSDQVWERNK
jgi:hypothetical protein